MIKHNTYRRYKTPGNIAVWILIGAELSEFALFFLAFLITKSHYQGAFSEGPLQLNTLAGTLNTITLISSSYFIALAIHCIKSNKRKQCLVWLWFTLLAGATYCCIKGWEYYWNEAAGFNSRTNSFFALYYYLTFNHLLHVIIGMATIFTVTMGLHLNFYDTRNHEGLEAAACYWHMIDLAWIIIFPLLYILK